MGLVQNVGLVVTISEMTRARALIAIRCCIRGYQMQPFLSHLVVSSQGSDRAFKGAGKFQAEFLL